MHVDETRPGATRIARVCAHVGVAGAPLERRVGRRVELTNAGGISRYTDVLAEAATLPIEKIRRLHGGIRRHCNLRVGRKVLVGDVLRRLCSEVDNVDAAAALGLLGELLAGAENVPVAALIFRRREAHGPAEPLARRRYPSVLDVSKAQLDEVVGFVLDAGRGCRDGVKLGHDIVRFALQLLGVFELCF